MDILNPTFSFVQFASGSAPADCDYLLPMILNSDLKFQVKISTSGAGQSNSVSANTQKLYVIKSDAIITDETTLSANTLYAQTDSFSAMELDDTNVLLCWADAITGIEDMEESACFRFCLKVTDGTTVLYFLSNCFQKISDTKYYNTLEYYCTADNYGFSYCDGCSNKVRLPLYLGGPQVKEDQTAYIYSNGTRKLTKYQAGKLFQVKVGTATDDIHNKITTALAHDIVNIESPRYTGGIRKDGDYTIAWDRPEDLDAPASTTAYATPYFVVNDNCAECVDYVPCVAPTVPDFTLDDAALGTAYNKTITLTGSAPFTLSAKVKPDWLSIEVSGSIITFSGTPGTGDDGTGITVSFTANNACGSDNGSATIDVTCDEVAITGSPSLPDGQSGVAYSYTFAVTGSTPFTLSDKVKPDWLSIEPDGSNINFSGTPATGDEGSGITISFTINNPCGTADFSDTIDITPGGVRFESPTGGSGDDFNYSETENVVNGEADATITLTLAITNSNGGTFKINGTTYSDGDTLTLDLDGTGAVSFTAAIAGIDNPGSGIEATFTITSTTSGTIGTPDNYSISKTFS